MSQTEKSIDTSALNRILENFSTIALRTDVTNDYEVWRFDVNEHRYILLYYPDERSRLEKRVTVSPAMRYFGRLQAMQSHKFPAPRVIATLKGFRIDDRKGDAVIINGSDRDSTLEQMLIDADLNGVVLDRIDLQTRVARVLQDLHNARLVPIPLSLRSFWKRRDELIPGESHGPSTGIVNESRLCELGAEAQRFTTNTERLRLWRHFLEDTRPPRLNPIVRSRAIELADHADRGRETFRLVEMGPWRGVAVVKPVRPVAWSLTSRLEIDPQDWKHLLPIDEINLQSHKNDGSGSVMEATIALSRQQVPIVIKRPHLKPGPRGVIDSFRLSRSRRAWRKTWRLLGSNFAVEYPLLLLERHRGFRVVEQMTVYERVPGHAISRFDFNSLDPRERQQFFWRCGRVLRQIARNGWSHFDAKSSNWIAWREPWANGTLRPVMIDCDSIRFYRSRRTGVDRLIRAVKTHPQFIEADEQAIRAGYDLTRRYG